MDERVMLKAIKLCAHFIPLREIIEEGGGHVDEAIIWVARRIEVYREAWVSHPQYDLWRAQPELSWMEFDDPSWAMVAMVLKHPPGIDYQTHSYVVCEIEDLPMALHWASSPKVGDFVGVLPATKALFALPYRLALHSYSMEGKARGYLCRQELKRLLPTKLRKHVTKFRTAKQLPKYSYLARPLRINGGQPFLPPKPGIAGTYGEMSDWVKANHDQLPDWYRKMTKADLWVECLAAENSQLFAQLSYWIDPKDFYRAVTGQMHPNEVIDAFHRLPKRAMPLPEQLTLI